MAADFRKAEWVVDRPPRVVAIVLAAALCTSSFDIFLAVDVGLMFRVAQLLLLVPMGYGLVLAHKRGARIPPGFVWLLAWTSTIFLFVPHNNHVIRSAGYACLLLYNVLLVLAFAQSFDIRTFPNLATWYIGSFVFVACFGILQFVMPLIGLSPPLVSQWWIPGKLARVNGFSYEPSFFCTYLLLGWITCMVLIERHSRLIDRRFAILAAVIMALAVVLSSSRMGIAVFALWLVKYPLLPLARNGWRRRRGLTLAVAGLVVVVVAAAWERVPIQEVQLLTQGIGLAGGSSSSVDDRFGRLGDVLTVFADSPIIGYSLGGVASGIATRHFATADGVQNIREFEGINITAEILAASGIIGFAAFLAFLFRFWQGARVVARGNGIAADWAAALLWAAVMELLILQLNQNILRVSVWVHFALLAAACCSSLAVPGRRPGTLARSQTTA